MTIDITPIDKLISELKDFQDNVNEIVLDLIALNEGKIVFLNTDNQMFAGFDARGKKIKPSYRPKTIRIKKRKGQPTNRVTLRDTGDFHDSVFIDYGKDSFEFKANDPKTKKLLLKYGKDVLGLNDTSLDILIQTILKPELIKEARKRFVNDATA